VNRPFSILSRRQPRHRAATYATGEVNGTARVTRGVVGENFRDCPFREGSTLCADFGPSTVSDSYWDTQATGQTTSAGGSGLATAGMQGDAARDNMAGLDFDAVWQTVPDDYPELRALAGTAPAGGDDGQSGATTLLRVDRGSTSVTAGGETTLTYTVSNPTGSARSFRLEFPSLPATVSVESVSGNVSADHLDATPPGASVTLRATVVVDASAAAGERELAARATGSSGASVLRNTTTTTLDVSAVDPLAARFGGPDNRVGNLDVLQAVNAANAGDEVGGEPVDNLDVLQLVDYVTAD
jgi:hypothetical protein